MSARSTHLHALERALRLRARVANPEQPRRELDVLARTERAVEHARVRDVADRRAQLRTAGQRHAGDAAASLAGAQQPREHAEQRRLPRAVRPEERQAVASLERERHLAHRDAAAEATAEPASRDHARVGKRTSRHASAPASRGISRSARGRYLLAWRGERWRSAARSAATSSARDARWAAYECRSVCGVIRSATSSSRPAAFARRLSRSHARCRDVCNRVRGWMKTNGLSRARAGAGTNREPRAHPRGRVAVERELALLAAPADDVELDHRRASAHRVERETDRLGDEQRTVVGDAVEREIHRRRRVGFRALTRDTRRSPRRPPDR